MSINDLLEQQKKGNKIQEQGDFPDTLFSILFLFFLFLLFIYSVPLQIELLCEILSHLLCFPLISITILESTRKCKKIFKWRRNYFVGQLIPRISLSKTQKSLYYSPFIHKYSRSKKKNCPKQIQLALSAKE